LGAKRFDVFFVAISIGCNNLKNRLLSEVQIVVDFV